MARPGVIKRLEITERRRKVAALAVKGYNQKQIAQELGLPPGAAGQVMVSKDLQAVRKEWQQSAVKDFDGAKVQQLAKLAELERELWAAWERSKSEAVETKVLRQLRKRVLGRGGEDGEEGDTPRDPSLPEETVTEEVGRRKEHSRKQRDGNPAFAQAILHVVQEENELYGLKVKDNSPSTSPPVVAFDVREAGTDEQAEGEEGAEGMDEEGALNGGGAGAGAGEGAGSDSPTSDPGSGRPPAFFTGEGGA
jgi:hypothetical protein